MVLSQGMGIKLIKIISSTPVAGGCFISVGHLLGLSISPAWRLAATFISSQWCIDLSHWVRESHKPSSPTSSLPAILDREKSPIYDSCANSHLWKETYGADQGLLGFKIFDKLCTAPFLITFPGDRRRLLFSGSYQVLSSWKSTSTGCTRGKKTLEEGAAMCLKLCEATERLSSALLPAAVAVLSSSPSHLARQPMT